MVLFYAWHAYYPTHTPSHVLFQIKPCYQSHLHFPAHWFCWLFFHHAWLPTPRLEGRSKRSSHQTEHDDLPHIISISGANWRWFSITVLTSGNRRIRVILSIWQAVIRETIWRSLCFKWIIAWFTQPAWRAFLPAWRWWIWRCMCEMYADRSLVIALSCLHLMSDWMWKIWNVGLKST